MSLFLCLPFTGFYSCNTEIMPGIYNWTSAVQVTHYLVVYFIVFAAELPDKLENCVISFEL